MCHFNLFKTSTIEPDCGMDEGSNVTINCQDQAFAGLLCLLPHGRTMPKLLQGHRQISSLAQHPRGALQVRNVCFILNVIHRSILQCVPSDNYKIHLPALDKSLMGSIRLGEAFLITLRSCRFPGRTRPFQIFPVR